MSSSKRDFIIGALIGLTVPLGILALHVDSPAAFRILWPLASLGLGYWGNHRWIMGLLLGTVELGVNALVYGLIGAAVGQVFQRIGRGRSRTQN